MLEISNSEIRSFTACRRKWYLQSYRRLTPISFASVGARQLGTRVHAALEIFYSTDPEKYRSLPHALAELDRLREEELEAQAAPTEDIIKQDAMSQAMVTAYVDWVESDGADFGMEVIAAEIKLQCQSPHPDVQLVGKLDLLVRLANGKICSFDHKVKQSVSDGLDVLGLDTQLLTYMTLIRCVHPNEPAWDIAGGLHNVLQKSAWKVPPKNDKTRRFGRFHVYHDSSELEIFWDQTYGRLEQMVNARQQLDAGRSHQIVCPPTPTRDCGWSCDFVAPCQSMNIPNDDAEHLLNNNYQTYNPMERYEDKDPNRLEKL
jgi:PD-(D/E)XK nuclease superfamily